MKNEKKRYFLVEYYGNKRSITVDTLEEAKNLIKKVKNYNNRKYSNFLMGNITIKEENGKYHLESHLYKKYTDRMTISELDNFTSKMNESELAKVYEDTSKMVDGVRPDINIAYLETKNKDKDEPKYLVGIKYIPVLYKEDLKYIDYNYILSCLYFHASIKDYDFFKSLALEFSLHHFVSDEVSDLFEAVDKSKNQFEDLDLVFRKSCKLYSKFIREYERDESFSRDEKGKYIISRRRLRDFGFFVKNYDIRDSKKKSPLMYNYPLPASPYTEEENGQLKLKL